MNHTEAAQYIKATLTAFGPGEAISMTKETWAKIHEAMRVLAQPEQEPVARYFENYQGQPTEEIDEERFNQTPDECRFKLYTAPPQPEQSQVEETLRYEIDALEAKLAECRLQQQESVAKRLMDCNDCGGTGVDGDVDDRGLTIDVECRSCAGSGKSRYFGSCTNGGRCLQGCLNTEGCYWEKRVAKVQPEQPAQQEHVATSDTSEKRVDEMAKQRHEPEPVIDKSAAIRIATSLGWTPQRTWVGLTDEEIMEPWPFENRVAFARWLEAKLKEKNT